jgi:hypothetical protein
MSIVRTAAAALGLTLLMAVPAQAIMLAMPPLTHEALDEWLATFNEVNVPTKGLNVEVVGQLNTLNEWIQSPDDIEIFRGWPQDDAVVDALVPLAAGQFSETRVPATLILGNVVDDSNVCYLLGYLATDIDNGGNGQFNLLQVVRQVAGYAAPDVGVWIKTVVDQKLDQLGKMSNVENTTRLLGRIDAALASQGTGSSRPLSQSDPARFAACGAALPPEFTEGQNPVASLDAATIRDGLFAPDHRTYATQLANLYAQANEADRTKLLAALIGAIIGPKEEPERRYRVNLYVAVTLTKEPMLRVLTEPAQQQALIGLKGTPEYVQDPTFQETVDAALAHQGL